MHIEIETGNGLHCARHTLALANAGRFSFLLTPPPQTRKGFYNRTMQLGSHKMASTVMLRQWERDFMQGLTLWIQQPRRADAEDAGPVDVKAVDSMVERAALDWV